MKNEIPEIEIECVKIIGKIKGISTKIELIMDKKTFLEWENKLKNENNLESKREYWENKYKKLEAKNKNTPKNQGETR